MSVFWSLMVAMLFVAALVAVTPLLNANEQPRKVGLAVCLVGVVGVLSLGLYHRLGDAPGLEQQLELKVAAKHLHKSPQAFASPEAVITTMVAQMKKHPDSVRGWQLLGQLYMSMQLFNKAVPAYAKAYTLRPADMAILEDYVEALFYANHNKLTAETRQDLKNILAKAPQDIKAVNLLALDAYTRGDYKQAIAHWQSLKSRFSKGSARYQLVDAAINRAKAKLQAKSTSSK